MIRVTLAALLALQPISRGASQPCHANPKLTGRCREVHARANFWNGSPSVRIWIVGTTRMLGVSEGRFFVPGYETMPEDVRSKLSFDTDLFGDFVVCPFTPQRDGEMQLVCVDAARSLSIRPARKPHD